MVWVEANKESPTYLAIKYQQTLKQEYELLDFAINDAGVQENSEKYKDNLC